MPDYSPCYVVYALHHMTDTTDFIDRHFHLQSKIDKNCTSCSPLVVLQELIIFNTMYSHASWGWHDRCSDYRKVWLLHCVIAVRERSSRDIILSNFVVGIKETEVTLPNFPSFCSRVGVTSKILISLKFWQAQKDQSTLILFLLVFHIQPLQCPMDI